jgi:hypothetical protein
MDKKKDQWTVDEFKLKMQKKHAKKMPSSNTNKLTKAILNWLNASGFKAWRNNTTGIWDAKKHVWRKHHGELGVSDILGMQKKTARFIAVEVKFGKDKLSPDQIRFLNDIKRGGGIAIEAKSFDDFLEKITPHIKVKK